MSEQNVIDAIHQLEIKLTKHAGEVSTILEVQNRKLDELIEDVLEQRELLYGSTDGQRPGLITRTSSLETTRRTQSWTLGAVIVAGLSATAEWIWKIFTA